jgi:hypothetical protein
MTKEQLREKYQSETGKEVEATETSIARIADCQEQQPDGSWKSVEMSWAEWGYVLWLEAQVISANDHAQRPARKTNND